MIVQGRLIHGDGTRPTAGWIRIEGEHIIEAREGPPPERPRLGGPDHLVAPGFVDAHVHLPQIDSVGCDGLSLMEWLDRVIYPAEMKWDDEVFAHRQAAAAYRRLLRAGTLGYAGYLTSHFHGWAAAVRAAHAIPIRGIAGQSLMDRRVPRELLEQRTARLAVSERGRLRASANPRFAVSCSEALLAETAKRAARRGDVVQTHLAESRAECALVDELFPNDPNYTAVYDRFGLLTPRTLLAHGVHLSRAEWELIRKRQSVVVHCPSANTFLESGLFDLEAAREHGVRLALGSDVAAGPDLAMPRVARAMIEVAKVRRMTVAPDAPVPSPEEAWRLITRGNAEALGWDDAGKLEAGAAADVLVLRVPFEVDEHIYGRLIYGWDDAWIAERIVAGRIMPPDHSAS